MNRKPDRTYGSTAFLSLTRNIELAKNPPKRFERLPKPEGVVVI